LNNPVEEKPELKNLTRKVVLECLQKDYTNQLIGYTSDPAPTFTLYMKAIESELTHFTLEEYHDVYNQCRIKVANNNY